MVYINESSLVEGINGINKTLKIIFNINEKGY